MKLTPNVTKYAQKCLKYNHINKTKPYRSIVTIVQYLHNKEGINDLETIHELVLDYLVKCGRDDLKVDLGYIAKSYKPEHYLEVEEITISHNEINKILNSGYPYSWQKILFVMLVHYKAKEQALNVTSEKIEFSMNELMQDAHVSLSTAKRTEMLRAFGEDGFVAFANGGKKAQHLYLTFLEKEDFTPAVTVTEFENFYLYFEQIVKGGKLKICKTCGTLMLDKGKTNQMIHCQPCSKKRRLERKSNKNKS